MAQDSPVAMVTPPGKPVSAKDVEDMECDYMTQERYKLHCEKCGRRGHAETSVGQAKARVDHLLCQRPRATNDQDLGT